MPAWLIPAFMAGLSALSGGLANREQTSRSSSTGRSYGSNFENLYGSTTPNFDPAAQGFRDQIMQEYMKALNAGPADLTGYEAQVTSDINKLADFKKQNIEET